MRILNAIHAQSIGGVNQMFCNYASSLIKGGHEVSLLISDNGNDNYKISNVKEIFKLKNNSQIFDCLKLLAILLTYRPQVIICHSNRLMKWMKILRFFTSTKSIAINHGISFKNSLNCNYVISINEQISNMVVAAGFDKSKSFVLPNIINIDCEYKPKKLTKPLTVGIYGRIESRKGFDILIKAAAILLQNNIDLRLKIGGFEVSGSYNWQYLEDLAKESKVYNKCKFVGVVTDKKSFFEDVDIFCVPSREEPFGLVILEGFLHSTLVVSSDSVGGKFLIKHEENGLLFQNEDHKDLADKILFAINNQEKYCHFTKKAYLKLTDQFSEEKFTKSFNQILDKIF